MNLRPKISKVFSARALAWGLPLLVLAAGLVVSNIIRHSRPETPVSIPKKIVPVVRGIIAKETSFRPVIKAQGTVTAKQKIELVPEVAGKIVWVSPSFAQGGLFNKGEELVRIDPRNYQFAVSSARASVADARNILVLEKAESALAKSEWNDLGQGEASSLVLREPQLKSAQAKLDSAVANLDRALLDLERTKIKAPFDGRVEEKNVDVGQYISLGSKLAVLYSTDIAEILLPLTDNQLGKLDLQMIYAPQVASGAAGQTGLDVDLYANVAGKRRKWTGKIVRTAGTVDLNSRILSVIVEVRNPYQVRPGGAPLLNGLFVEAEIPGREMDHVFILPRAALRNQNQVVIVDKKNKLRSRTIEIIHSTRQDIIVRGLKSGERVNISPLEVMIEGEQVKWTLAAEDRK